MSDCPISTFQSLQFSDCRILDSRRGGPHGEWGFIGAGLGLGRGWKAPRLRPARSVTTRRRLSRDRPSTRRPECLSSRLTNTPEENNGPTLSTQRQGPANMVCASRMRVCMPAVQTGPFASRCINRRCPRTHPLAESIRSAPVPSRDGRSIYLGVRTRGRGLQGALVAISATTGVIEWSLEVRGAIESTPAVDEENEQVFGTSVAGELVAADAATGGVRWRARADAPIRGTPTLDRGRVFSIISNGNVVVALDAKREVHEWTQPLAPTTVTSPTAVGGLVVASTRDHIVAFDAHTGQTRWIAAVGGASVGAVFDPALQAFVAGCADGSLYVLASETGELLAHEQTGASITSVPAASGGDICIKLADGSSAMWSATSRGFRDTS